MVDTDIVGCNWLELPAEKYILRPQGKVRGSVGVGSQSGDPAATDMPHPCRPHCVSWRQMCCGLMWSVTRQKGSGSESHPCVCSALTLSVLAAKVCLPGLELLLLSL